MSMDEYLARVRRMQEQGKNAPPLPAPEVWSEEMRQDFSRAGFATREDILELSRQVKRDQLADRLGR